jgi:serine/threonine protein phosphatase PrpC
MHFQFNMSQSWRDCEFDCCSSLPSLNAPLPCRYCGVFDGHGGPEASNWLSKEFHGILGKLAKSPRVDEATLVKAFEAGDQQLLKQLEKMGTDVKESAGSTGTVAILSDSGKLSVANVGDSELYVLRGKSSPIPMVKPHRVYGSGPLVKSEIERVKSTGGWIEDGRVCNILAVSRAFGDWEFKGLSTPTGGIKNLMSSGVEKDYWEKSFADKIKFSSDPVTVSPSFTEIDITEDDELFVIATDGMWDVLPPAEVLKLAKSRLKQGDDATQAAEFLVETALRRKTTDNVCCIVVDLKGKEHWQASASSSGGFLSKLFSR